MSRRAWWIAAALVTVAALVFCGWWARDLLARPGIHPAGASFTDHNGVTFTVIGREELSRIESNGELIVEAHEGAVLLRYTVQIDDYTWDAENKTTTSCGLNLVRADREEWQGWALSHYDPQRPIGCNVDPGYTTSQQIYPVFEVPVDQVDDLLGLINPGAPDGWFPIISEP